MGVCVLENKERLNPFECVYREWMASAKCDTDATRVSDQKVSSRTLSAKGTYLWHKKTDQSVDHAILL